MTLENCLSTEFSSSISWLLAGLLPGIGVLFAAAPTARRRLKTAVIMVACSAAGLLVSAVLRDLGADPRSLSLRACEALSHLLLSAAVIHTCGVLVFDLLLARMRLGVSALIQDLILAVAYAAAALSVLSEAGANLSSLLATSAVVTAVLAFSLQDTLGNVLGGMVLQLERSFSAGDRIRVAGDEGLVREIRWRQTTLETLSGNTIVIPNSILMKSTVTVLGRRLGQPPGRWSDVRFSVYYDRPPSEVIAAVQQSLRGDPPPCVASEPPPDCVLVDLKADCAVYAACYLLTDLAAGDITDAAVRVRVYYALSRAGIKLSVPTRAVVVMQRDEDVQERYKRQELERRVAALRGVDMLRALTPEEFNVLADRLRPSPFSPGEVITRQGAHAEWLYILYAGEAEVRLYAEGGSSFQAVSRLRSGDFLGEMGLMTGEPRSATVIALSEVGCYRLDREGFTDIILNRPAIAETISLILAKRRVELDAARTGLTEEMRLQRLQTTQGDFLSRIRDIFSLGV